MNFLLKINVNFSTNSTFMPKHDFPAVSWYNSGSGAAEGPPGLWLPPQPATARRNQAMSFGIYFHIPYCLSKCRYCDFYSAPASRQVPEEYVQALLARLRQFAPARPDTVYFGGGTPSLLTPGQLQRLIDAANPLPGAEITLEANPETLTPDLLRGFRAAGANRLSLGVQTASDQSLRTLGRPHTARESRLAFEMARAAGFDNISGDIMLALPGYSLAEFDDTLSLIKEGGASHISA